MNSDDDTEKVLEQIRRDFARGVRLFNPDEYSLNDIYNDVISVTASPQREKFLRADREEILFEVFCRINDYENSSRDTVASLSDLIFSQYLISSNRSAGNEES
ncbi:MAG: hypothetical protein K6L73_10115 [Cellvibrionaceae bacterium]